MNMLKKIFTYMLFLVLMYSTKVSANWAVVCYNGPAGIHCWAWKGDCPNSTPKYFSCDQLSFLSTNSKPTFIIKTKNGTAFFSINGKKTQIASDALESFLVRKINELDINSSNQKMSNDKSYRDKFDKELNDFLKTDKWLVTDKRLSEISKQLGISIKETND
jgi:hypothetical protein